jgi:putative transposase
MDKIFHYTFRTYKKKQILIGEIADDLGRLFNDICQEKSFELISYSVLVDHVHMLIKKDAGDSNEYVMKMIKGISSREIFKKYPGNRFELRKLWGRGYHAVEVKDQESLNRTIEYINSQTIDGIDKRALGSRKPRRSVAGFPQPAWNPRRSVSGFHISQRKEVGSRDVQSQAST